MLIISKNKMSRWLAMLTLVSLTMQNLAFAATGVPSDVESLTATPGDKEVTLQWTPALDDQGVKGYYVYYGISSVPAEASEYSLGYEDAGDVTEYTMEDLKNDFDYYFAVIAYDEDGNTSEYYSNEVKATPTASSSVDTEAPSVKSVKALTSTLVEVKFSENIVLPKDPATAFSIESEGKKLAVLDAYAASTKNTVMLVTTEQTAEQEYTLTVGITLEDQAGNPVEAGKGDQGDFAGTAVAQLDEEESIEETLLPGFLEDVDSEKANEVMLYLNETVDLKLEDIKIYLEEDKEDTLKVLSLTQDEEDALLYLVETEDMKGGESYVVELVDKDSRMAFRSGVEDIADVIAPEDITNLLSKVLNETSVVLTWTESVNTAGDLSHYLVYQELENEGFGKGMKQDKGTKKLEVSDLEAGKSYRFKVTAVDESGNESEGVLTTVTLPEAGPALGLLAGLSLLASAGLGRRRS